jgi:hypothetical protein
MRLAESFALSLLIGGAALGCGEKKEMEPPVVVEKDKAIVNVVHGSPDAPAVDIYLNGVRAVSGLGYRKSTGNVTLDAGKIDVALRAAGAAADSPPAYSTTVTLPRDSRTLVLAQGRLGGGDGSTAFRLSLIPFGAADASGVKLRFVHGSPSAPVVDIAAGDNTLADDVAFGAASAFATLPGDVPGKTQLSVRPGSAPIDLAFVSTPATAIGKGAVLTAIAFGEIDPLAPDDRFLGVSALEETSGALIDLDVALNDKGPKASFYVFHASPDAPAVDVALRGGDLLARGLAYQAATPLLDVPAGVYPVEVRAAGGRDAVLSANVKLLPALGWGLFARGLLSDGGKAERKLGLSSIPLSPKGEKARLRVVHASPDAPAVDIVAGGARLVSGLSYLQATAQGEIGAAVPAVTLKVRPAGGSQDLFDITVSDAVSAATKGQNVTVFATGLAAGKPAFQAMAVVESSADPSRPLAVVALPTQPSK